MNTAAVLSHPTGQAPLPYDINALAPVISANTLAYHYGKHHRGYVDTKTDAYRRSQWACASEISSPSRERKIFKIGDEFVFLYPTARSMVGTSPFNGRLTTDQGNKFLA
jgi:superoxide dismutase